VGKLWREKQYINQQTKSDPKLHATMQNATQAHRHLIATNNNAGDKNRSPCTSLEFGVGVLVSTFRVPEQQGNNWPFATAERGCCMDLAQKSNGMALQMEGNAIEHRPILAEIQYACNRFGFDLRLILWLHPQNGCHHASSHPATSALWIRGTRKNTNPNQNISFKIKKKIRNYRPFFTKSIIDTNREI